MSIRESRSLNVSLCERNIIVMREVCHHLPVNVELTKTRTIFDRTSGSSWHRPRKTSM